MKYSHKISFVLVAVLCVALSFYTFVTVKNNFSVSLEAAIEQNLASHKLERYALANSINEREELFMAVNKTWLENYGASFTKYNEEGNWFCLLEDTGKPIYSLLPETIAVRKVSEMVQNDEQGYRIMPSDQQMYLFVTSTLQFSEGTVKLLTAHDVTAVFAERTRQLKTALLTNYIVLGISGLLAVFLVGRFSESIEHLCYVSQRVSQGELSLRSGLQSGDEIGSLGYNYDSMLNALEDKINQLDEMVHQREDFIAAFTHEIKTPMTAIIGYADILRFEKNTPEFEEEASNFIYWEAKRLENLSEKLLALMGLSYGKIQLEPCSVEKIVKKAIESLEKPGKTLAIQVLPSPTVELACQPELFVDLLRNLLLNAKSATKTKGEVCVYWELQENTCSIVVKDTGIGVPQEEIKNLTQPFYMVDKARQRQQGSSGIGLALAQKIVEVHRGTLEFESELGVYTRVRVNLPIGKNEKETAL